MVVDAGIPFEGTPRFVQWRACRGSKERYRGMPCGLWTLYHAVLSNAPPGTAPAALDAIHAYVLAFFFCAECRKNFAAEPYELAASDEAAVLWLVRKHNRVNAALVADASTDPRVPKVQFPARAACPACNEGGDTDATFRYLAARYRWSAAVPSAVPHKDQNLSVLLLDAGVIDVKVPHGVHEVANNSLSGIIMLGGSIIVVLGCVYFVAVLNRGEKKSVHRN
jgi:hypothetical protein